MFDKFYIPFEVFRTTAFFLVGFFVDGLLPAFGFFVVVFFVAAHSLLEPFLVVVVSLLGFSLSCTSDEGNWIEGFDAIDNGNDIGLIVDPPFSDDGNVEGFDIVIEYEWGETYGPTFGDDTPEGVDPVPGDETLQIIAETEDDEDDDIRMWAGSKSETCGRVSAGSETLAEPEKNDVQLSDVGWKKKETFGRVSAGSTLYRVLRKDPRRAKINSAKSAVFLSVYAPCHAEKMTFATGQFLSIKI